MRLHGATLIVLLFAMLMPTVGSTQQQPAPAAAEQQPRTPRTASRQPQVDRQVANARQVSPPFVLSPTEEARVNNILQNWQARTADIQRFSCQFQRFEYQPQFSTNKNKPHSISEGVIHFRSPDKAEFQVIRRTTNGQVETGDHIEHWICDGSTIYDYDSRQKLLREQKLPPEWQGKAITNGPLPFLFGANAAKIKARYWVREVDAQRPGEIWLEIHPKTREDASNYRLLLVMLSWQHQQDDFLPNGMRVYRLGNTYENYSFTKRAINARQRLFENWVGGRFRPSVPPGWKRVVDNNMAGGETATDTNRVARKRENNEEIRTPQ